MQRLTLTLFAFFALSLQAFSQNVIRAEEIIQKINRGENIRLENTEIIGPLDLTALENRRQTKKGGKWFSHENEQFESTVDVTLTFVQCTFADDVLAYYHDDDVTYIAHFTEDVVFEQCTFEEASEFKYSEFPEKASFSKSIFEEAANFKYAEFSEGPDFSACIFKEEANFKYAEFDDAPAYADVVFEEEANFKYADFPEGVNFESAVFNDLANFKYTKFSEPLNIKNVSFNGEEDFKYTKVGGRDFTTFLLNKR